MSCSSKLACSLVASGAARATEQWLAWCPRTSGRITKLDELQGLQFASSASPLSVLRYALLPIASLVHDDQFGGHCSMGRLRWFDLCAMLCALSLLPFRAGRLRCVLAAGAPPLRFERQAVGFAYVFSHSIMAKHFSEFVSRRRANRKSMDFCEKRSRVARGTNSLRFSYQVGKRPNT